MKNKLLSCSQLMRLFLFFIFAFCVNDKVLSVSKEEIDKVWQEYRVAHPYGFQAVGLKHIDDECLFIISEPSEEVEKASLNNLFAKYNGTTETKRYPFGYDGWLADYVGCARFDSTSFDLFTQELFTLLYGIDYKPYYIDLDQPQKHTYFALQNLNYSISAAEIEKWMLIDKELFVNLNGQKKNISQILSLNMPESNELWYSLDRGFVVWCFDSQKHKTDQLFKLNARKFALDADLILGAIGQRGKKFVIIARERNVSTNILPPLRIETIQLLATTNNDNLAQSYERYHVFAGKSHLQQDFAPIYLSDELWHTEYGNLLNLTDQMLKSWSENGRIDYHNFNYPKPIDWAFDKGALRDLGSEQLTYNWNTAGAGYVIQGDDLDIFAVNRTGSLPVSYIPGGMEGKVDENVNDAEEMAYDFFSGLNCPELVRVVQYASLYQIFRYYLDNSSNNDVEFKNFDEAFPITSLFNSVSSLHSNVSKFTESISIPTPQQATKENEVPSYACLEPYIERILKLTDSTDIPNGILDSAIERYCSKAQMNNPYIRLKDISATEEGESLLMFIKDKMGVQYVDSILSNPNTRKDAEREFYTYYNSNVSQVRNYINTYTKKFGKFPYSKAAHYIVNPRKLSKDINETYAQMNGDIRKYSAYVKVYNEEVDKFNASVRTGTANTIDNIKLMNAKRIIDDLEQKIIKQQKENENEIAKLSLLIAGEQTCKSVAALNWLITDPKKYTEPLGDFFSDMFKANHNTWIKSPSLACSFIETGYGGHNLDAHVTPIRLENVKAGKCRISFVDGQRVVSVSKADRSRVTPEVLRQIERRISDNREINLPEAPIIRTKSAIFEEMNTLSTERGFSPKFEIAEVSPSKTVSINDVNYGTLDELYSSISDAIANNEPLPVKEIRYKGISAREAQIQIDNLREYVLERTLNNEAVLGDFDVNEIEAVVKENGLVVITIPQKQSSIPQNTYKAGMMEFQVPAEAEDVFKTIIKKVADMPEEKINNHFKMIRQIKKELQKHPEIKIQDVKDEYIRLYGFILFNNDKNCFTNMVA